MTAELEIKALEELIEKLKTGKCKIASFTRESTQCEIIDGGVFSEFESGITICAKYLYNENEVVRTKTMFEHKGET